jgi:hypothetical protein
VRGSTKDTNSSVVGASSVVARFGPTQGLSSDKPPTRRERTG